MSREHGVQLAKLGKTDEAKQEFVASGDYLNLSVMLAREQRDEEAIDAALEYRSVDPFKACAQAMKVSWEMGDWGRVDLFLTKALELNPGDPDLLTARGTYRLLRGDKGGWEDVEQRPWAKKLRDACDEFPEWDGVSSLADKSLLVLFQDGHGDRVMFSRFLNNVLETYEPDCIVLFCSPETARMFKDCFPKIRVVSSHSEIGGVDLWIGLSSLGKCDFPISPAPYAVVPEGRKQEFSAYFKENCNLRVGLAWAGNAKHTQDHTRSKSFSFFEPLLSIKGIDFYSLQFEEHNRDHGGKINELSVYCRDTADTMAAISNLDLVIAVDTGMNHFAGALGIPAWVVCFTPIDWRWGLLGKKSYWYGSASVYRNPDINRIYKDLAVEAAIHPQVVKRTVSVRKPITRQVKTRYGDMTVFSHELWLSRGLEEYGEWAQGEMDLMRGALSSESVMIDAGANIGDVALAMSPYVKHVLAFEPQGEPFDLLKKNVEDNGIKNVSMIEAGLGSYSSIMQYAPSAYDRVTSPVSTRLGSGGRAGAKVVTIDSFEFKRLDLIKADVEGMELDVLRGAEDTIKRLRPLLYLENNDIADRTELLLHVHNLGYRMYQHDIPLFNPNNFRGNELNIFGDWDTKMLFCVPRERYDLRSITKNLCRIRIEQRLEEN